MRNTPLINLDFRRSVESHIFGNLLIKETRSPLILGIFGPPGEGKTFQLDEICRSLGINQIVISPGELESENAGHPAQLLRKLYIEAGSLDLSINSSKPSVLVINDVDTVLGNWGTLVQYTVNRQILYGQLMAFCDFPNDVSGHPTKRVPIIITGNNPSILYPPLLRAGRMRLMPWVPTLNEKLQIIARIFPDISERHLEHVVQQYPHKPISFWSDVNSRFWESKLMDWISSQPRDILLTNLHNYKQFFMGQAIVTKDDLAHFASELSLLDISNETFVSTGDR